MTDNGAIEQPAGRIRRRTRRQLLAGGAAAVGVVATQSLVHATRAAAANGDPIVMGTFNQSTSNTTISDSSGDTTFTASAMASGTALDGTAVDGVGVFGNSVTGIGVSGTTDSTADHAAAIAGTITNPAPGAFSAAVRGQNDGTAGDGIGVYGSHSGAGWGVYGTSVSGVGVNGAADPGGIGVQGSGQTGVLGSGTTGVHGFVTTPRGVGVLAENGGDGPALKVNGVAAFSRSGVATVPAGRSEVGHRLSLSSASVVLATIQGNVKDLYVRGVTVAAGTPGSFTIHLSRAVTTKTRVAWLVVN